MEAELDRLMEGLGAKIKKKGVKSSAPRMFLIVLSESMGD